MPLRKVFKMAKTCKITKVVKNPDGTIDVHILSGRPPVGASSLEEVLSFPTLAALGDEMLAAEENLTPRQMAMIRIAAYMRQTNDVNLATPANLKDRALTLDLAATSTTIAIT